MLLSHDQLVAVHEYNRTVHIDDLIGHGIEVIHAQCEARLTITFMRKSLASILVRLFATSPVTASMKYLAFLQQRVLQQCRRLEQKRSSAFRKCCGGNPL